MTQTQKWMSVLLSECTQVRIWVDGPMRLAEIRQLLDYLRLAEAIAMLAIIDRLAPHP